MIDTAKLIAALGEEAGRLRIDLLKECPSTNTALLAQAQRGAPTGSVLIALRQTAGRGRLGRRWHASPAASLTFSLLWHLPQNRSPLGLPLAAGVAVAQALEEQGERDIALKWPNDLQREGRKLGGILVELTGGAEAAAVIGVGLNLALPTDLPSELRDACSALAARHDPALLLASLLRHLADACRRFALAGFAPFRETWQARHAYQGQAVQLVSDGALLRTGICRGVDEHGALLLTTEAGCERIYAGEISLRPL